MFNPHPVHPEAEQLLPCPFCGGEWVKLIHPANGSAKRVGCKACNASGPFAASWSVDGSGAIAAWNTRLSARARHGVGGEERAGWLKMLAEADPDVGIMVCGTAAARLHALLSQPAAGVPSECILVCVNMLPHACRSPSAVACLSAPGDEEGK